MSIGEKLDRIIEILEDKKVQEENEVMNINDLITYLGNKYKKASIYTMSSTGTIPCTHKPLRFKKSEIDNWLKNK